MTVRAVTLASGRRGALGARPPLLDVAAEVLVADPAASLAQVAEAAGIGRTTLHKHYATRDDLIHAVGHRVLGLWEQAVAEITGTDDPDGGLRAAAEAIQSGRLAPLDAPGLALSTFLHGIGTAHGKETP